MPKSNIKGYGWLIFTSFTVAWLGWGASQLGVYFSSTPFLQGVVAPIGGTLILLFCSLQLMEKPSFGNVYISKVNFALFSITRATSVVFFIGGVLIVGPTSALFYLYVASFLSTMVKDSFVEKRFPSVGKISIATVAIFGLYLFTDPIELSLIRGVILCLACGVSETVYFTAQQMLPETLLKNSYARRRVFMWSFVVTLLILMMASVLRGEFSSPPPQITSHFVIVVVFICVVYFMAIEGLFKGLKYADGLHFANITLSSEILFATGINTILQAQQITSRQALGILVLAIAIVLVGIISWRKELSKTKA